MPLSSARPGGRFSMHNCYQLKYAGTKAQKSRTPLTRIKKKDSKDNCASLLSSFYVAVSCFQILTRTKYSPSSSHLKSLIAQPHSSRAFSFLMRSNRSMSALGLLSLSLGFDLGGRYRLRQLRAAVHIQHKAVPAVRVKQHIKKPYLR